jgi:ABC-type Fe3+/spermidine/putrescine transport system ATPase subunit
MVSNKNLQPSSPAGHTLAASAAGLPGISLTSADDVRGVGIGFEGLTKTYSGVSAVDDVSFTVAPGEFVTVLGPSGSGKTTLLMLVAGFTTPSSGRLLLGGNDISMTPPYRRDIGVVFQSYALFPHLNVRKNVGFALKARKVPQGEIDKKVDWALSLVHMSAYGDRRISQLSGGQQQRIALARAIAFSPRALLMDEPLAALDRNLRGAMQREIRALQKSLNQTVIFVTHDQEEALSMSDRVAVMNHGRLQQIATPKDLYLKPANSFVAGFFGEANLFSGDAAGDTLLVGDRRLPLPSPMTGKAVLCVRPEVLKIERDARMPWAIPATVTDARFMGSIIRMELDTFCGPLVATRQIDSMAAAPQIGSSVHVSWETAMSNVMAS